MSVAEVIEMYFDEGDRDDSVQYYNIKDDCITFRGGSPLFVIAIAHDESKFILCSEQYGETEVSAETIATLPIYRMTRVH